MFEIENKEKIKLENLRKIRAYGIIAKGDTPVIVNEETFLIPSQSNPKRKYTITHHDGWSCSCPDFLKTRGLIQCKHIQAIQMWLKFRDSVDNDILELKTEIDHPRCDKCGSFNVVRNGQRQTQRGVRQRYICNDCGHRFTPEPIRHRKANTKLIALCMDLYFKGLSLRKIVDTVEQFYNLKLHHDTIRVWINTFMEKITKYVNKYNPDVGKTWNIDEQKVKSDGEWVYSWNILDTKTRFLIANTITKGRSILETKKVMKKGRLNAETRPKIVVTDKMTAYPCAVDDEFNGAVHVQAGIRDPINNNKLERFHGTWRERDKVMRGLQSDKTTEQMLDHYRTYYNFIRPHASLNGRTPSEMAGVTINLGRNKWYSLIEKSV